MYTHIGTVLTVRTGAQHTRPATTGGVEAMLTVRDVAQRLGCSPQTVRNLIHAGRLPATRRLGTPRGAWQIAELAVAEFAETTSANDDASTAA